MSAGIRPRTVVVWSTIFSIAACNSLWGIDDGRLFEPTTQQAGAPSSEPGGAGGDGEGSQGAANGDGGAKPIYERAPRAGDAGQGGEPARAGSGNGGSSPSGGSISGGSMSGGSGGMSGGTAGTAPTCSGCKPGDPDTETVTCGRCGTGSKSHTRTCDANCTWGPWSAWTVCSQCDEKPYRCCGAGMWEWCYDDGCAWTNTCKACAASSCPGC